MGRQTRRGRGRRTAWILIAGMLWLHLLFFIRQWDGIRRGFTDFAVFYSAGKIVRLGQGPQLYDRQLEFQLQQAITGSVSFRQGPLPYIHPPFEALIFEPFSLISYTRAFCLWSALSLCELFAAALVLRNSVHSLRSIASWKLVAGALALFPALICLTQGQDSILQLLFFSLAWRALKNGRDFRSGCWLALAAFKFQFVLPVVLLLVIWRRRQVGLGFLAAAGILTLISLRMVGFEALAHYPGFLLLMEQPRLGGVPFALMTNLRGLIYGWMSVFSQRMNFLLSVLASLGIFSWAAWQGRISRREGRLELQFSLAVVVALLVGWQTKAYDLSLLILPLVLLADFCVQPIRRENRSRFRLLLPALPWLASPLWLLLWVTGAPMNLMAAPLVWWTWEIGKALRESSVATAAVQASIAG